MACRIKHIIAFSLVAFFSAFGICRAQSNMIVEHYTIEQGLPNNIVDCSLKDCDGFLWFGTWYGLCSFDGIGFTPYITRINNHSDIPPRKIQNIVEDNKGFIWIQTIDRRLYVFDKHKETFHEVYNEIKNLSRNVQIIKIQRMPDGNILLLTKDKNLFVAKVLPDGRVVIRLLYDARNDINPYDMKLMHSVLGETKDYILWIGQDYKIIAVPKCKYLCGGILKQMRNLANCSDIYYDGYITWIALKNGSIYSINTNTGKINSYLFSKIKSPITSIVQKHGVLYLASESGIYICSKKYGFQFFPMSCSDIKNINIDTYHKIWFSDSDKALVYYDPGNRIMRRYPFADQKKVVELQIQDAGENGLFILTPYGEVWKFDRDSLSMTNIGNYRTFAEDHPNQRFFNISLDRDGILWLSSTVDGIYRISFPPHQFHFAYPQLLSGNGYGESGVKRKGIRALLQTHNGDIWVGTRWGDVYCLDVDGKAKKYFRGTIGNVYNIMEDNRGRLWFSTKGEGLVKAEHNSSSPQGMKLTRYVYNPRQLSSISSNNVYYTYQDKVGRIWVCTFGGGLNLIEEQGGKAIFHHKYNGFRNYPAYGLYMDVRSITEDNVGRMWVGTDDGLFSFKNDFARIEDIRFETYRNRVGTGVLDKDIYAMYKDASGTVWIGVFGGGLNKLVRYDENAHSPVFKNFGIQEGLNCDVVLSIIEDANKCLWLGTESGLSSLNRTTGMIRNYDRFDGFPNVEMEDNTAFCMKNKEIWIGCKQGILSFSPEKITRQHKLSYETFIVDFNVLNRDLRSFNPPIYDGSVKYAKEITLKHNQSMFTIEFASLNYMNQDRISYKYILEGYEKEWHFSGHNRIASYANVSPGHYVFRVQAQDEANYGVSSSCAIKVTVLPPWWATWWAYMIYAFLGIILLIAAIRLIYYMMKMKNEVYIGQRLAELKIRFFTNISHELRTPLTLVQGPIQELKEKENLSEKGKQYLNLMEKNTNQMLQLVNQILDFRKVQNGKMRLHVSLIDMNELLETLHREFQILADEKEIAFSFQMPADHVMIWCDNEKIDIIIRNLLSNAFKFTPNGGVVCVTLELFDEGQRCRIRVEDNGVSIPESQLTEIFERFSQADNVSDESSNAGTGIGLALSKEYVDLLQGNIWAENNTDSKGVAFVIELQTDKEHFPKEKTDFYVDDHTAASSEVSPKYSDANERNIDMSLPVLLLIEDNKDLCQMLKMQMDNLFNIYTANDGLDGIKKVYLYHPDIVVTDLMMPGLDGIELLKRIRKDFEISHIPVIVLTAKNSDEDKVSAIKLGANAYITKPFSRDYLVACINQQLNERRLFQEKMWINEGREDNNEEKAGSYEQHLVQKDVEFIKQIKDVIEQNLNETDFNIDSIASSIGLSRSAFFKKLKSLTGFAPVDLVKEIRLNKAVELIKNSDKNISEIAFEVGFRDSGYFSKCFRKKYNQTPREYQNEWRSVH